MAALTSRIDTRSDDFRSNRDALERQVADLMRRHGHGSVRDAWRGEIDWVWPPDPARPRPTA